MNSPRSTVVRKIIPLLIILFVIVGLRMFAFTTYYLGADDSVRLKGLEPHTLLFISRMTGDISVSDDLIYRDPLIPTGPGRRTLVSLGRCVALPGSLVKLSDGTDLPSPLRGDEISIDSTTLEVFLPLLLLEMGEKVGDISHDTAVKLRTLRKHRVSQDYYLIHTVDGAYIWLSRKDIEGRVIGALCSPF
ncbi:hypothetical protein [Porphyromonas sp.]|uniref:hypothetical protein n=1 Tax=Porphyromonas sp. TaxID=1924944 RepID=UPI0026DD34A9|nr:hypothetical protein [Porphyromonas sp.]MDO4770811.1 hypothetical protein [Porphyromonas sp.]